MTALVRTARTTPSAPVRVSGLPPVNAITPGMQASHTPASTASCVGHDENVLVSRRKRAKRRALRG